MEEKQTEEVKKKDPIKELLGYCEAKFRESIVELIMEIYEQIE